MFESSMMFIITDYAMKRSGKLHGRSPFRLCWSVRLRADTVISIICRAQAKDVRQPQKFMNHLDQVNVDLKATGLPELGAELKHLGAARVPVRFTFLKFHEPILMGVHL